MNRRVAGVAVSDGAADENPLARARLDQRRAAAVIADGRREHVVVGIGAAQGQLVRSATDKAHAADVVEIDRASAGGVEGSTANAAIAKGADGKQPVRGDGTSGIFERAAVGQNQIGRIGGRGADVAGHTAIGKVADGQRAT